LHIISLPVTSANFPAVNITIQKFNDFNRALTDRIQAQATLPF